MVNDEGNALGTPSDPLDKALSGRNKRKAPDCDHWPSDARRGSNAVWGPFRAGVLGYSGSQGGALGWTGAAPFGAKSDPSHFEAGASGW